MFGSFASVIIYRIKSQEWGIMAGRSHCKTCERNLSALELIPIFSWLLQSGKCRGCKQSISGMYPILELATGILFVAAWYFLIDPSLIFSGDIFEWSRMIFFMWMMFLTIIYVFYDILYLEIPESVLLLANIWVFWALALQWYGHSIIPYLPTWGWDIMTLALCAWIISALYYVMIAGLREVYDCLIVLACLTIIWAYMYFWDVSIVSSALLSGTVAALGVFISFFLQIVLSGGRAMWAGDLRIAILMWLLVGAALAFPAWMICYVVGSIVGIFLIIKFKINSGLQSSFNHQIPFGPFIASGYLAVLLFAPQIQSLLQGYF